MIYCGSHDFATRTSPSEILCAKATFARIVAVEKVTPGDMLIDEVQVMANGLAKDQG